MVRPVVLVLFVAFTTSFGHPTVEQVRANDNRQPAGLVRNGVLSLHLEARFGSWHPDGDDAAGADVPAFAEVGRPLQIPGPLIRVVAGTRVSATVRNALPNDTLLVHGLYARDTATKEGAPLQLLPGEEREVEFRLSAPGTYYYWATTMRRPLHYRAHEDSQLSGAIVVDPTPASGQTSLARANAADRVFVIGIWADTNGAAMPHGRRRVLATINGRSWPHTERLSYTVGDSVHWRVINTSVDIHPMHLHGFYYRVDARGDEAVDTTYAEADRDRVVTDLMGIGQTLRLTWVPERDGNWAFHCHIPEHIEARGPLGMLASGDLTHSTNHALQNMGGLVIAVHVAPRRGEMSTADRAAPGRHRFRLVVEERPDAPGTEALRFALGDGGAALRRDSVGRLGPPIVVQVGEPVSINVVNHSPHPTSVHWHGIELESYFDGIGGFSGSPSRLAPVIAPSDSFEARFTPPRPGTFIYHSHVDEGRQQPAGLIGAIIVLGPGQRYDPATDLLAVITSPVDSLEESRAVFINGRRDAAPLTLRLGVPHRLRIINITTARPGLRVALRRDTSVVQWRPLARDGCELPKQRQVMKPAFQPLTIGETLDFEITPQLPGNLRLDAVALQGPVLGSLVLRVER